ncbi:MAG TPA: peptidyl-alpha-hydroxyglycine alpha-amidating lyase family protein [Chloroflexota bacterium]|nr:peptidyl-alpha-hydroxyglycine alpha-amidating lyase family protein [Chloroflexota bacterium]
MALTRKLAFDLVPNWEQLPAGYHHRDVCGVAVDSRDRVYLITRDESRVIVYEPDGRFVMSWGEGIFTPRTHGITIGPKDEVYCLDDGDHTVRKFTTDGKLVLTLGTPGVASDTGYDGSHLESILRGGPPFNRPTNLAIAPSGDLYVTDGYGNARIHRFSSDGTLIQSWGQPGTGPGQFNLPHGICVAADGRVFVADRENDRVQIFSPDGEFIEQWTQVQRPTQIFIDHDGLIYVSELWWRPGQRSYVHGVYEQSQPGRVSVLDLSGNVVLRWGANAEPWTPGAFCAPHGICVDSRGDVYVGEVTYTFGIKPGGVPDDCHTFQKFAVSRG